LISQSTEKGQLPKDGFAVGSLIRGQPIVARIGTHGPTSG